MAALNPVYGYPQVDDQGHVTFIPQNQSDADITYGFGNNQYLTDRQQQIADSVQHAFDVSLAQRDRALQRYQMPQLASNVEDEALSRAITTANIANRPIPLYGQPTVNDPNANRPQPNWYDYLRQGIGGFSALAPFLMGTDALGGFMKQGLFGAAKNWFGGGNDGNNWMQTPPSQFASSFPAPSFGPTGNYTFAPTPWVTEPSPAITGFSASNPFNVGLDSSYNVPTVDTSNLWNFWGME